MILGFEIFQLSRTCQKLGHFIVLCNSLSEDLLNKMMAKAIIFAQTLWKEVAQ